MGERRLLFVLALAVDRYEVYTVSYDTELKHLNLKCESNLERLRPLHEGWSGEPKRPNPESPNSNSHPAIPGPPINFVRQQSCLSPLPGPPTRGPYRFLELRFGILLSDHHDTRRCGHRYRAGDIRCSRALNKTTARSHSVRFALYFLRRLVLMVPKFTLFQALCVLVGSLHVCSFPLFSTTQC